MKRDILLMTPGPVELDSEILLSGAQPLRHHRTNDFSPLFCECVRICKRLFKTEHHLFLVGCSGTGVMEAAIVNHFHPGEKIISVETGSFGERFTKIATAFRLEVVPLQYPWGYGARISDLSDLLDQHPDVKGVTVTFNETSTGVKNDIQGIGNLIKQKAPDAIFIADGVSGIGALPFEMDAWNVDVAVSGSQKGFIAPPGIGIIALSEKAFQKMQTVECNGFYFDLKQYKSNQDLPIPSFPWTPPISVMFSFHEALKYIESLGLEKVHAHYRKLAEGLRESLKALGLTIFTQPDVISDVLTVINAPPEVHPKKIVAELRERHRVLIAGGQGEIADRVFRITTIGAIGERELIATVGILEMALFKFNVIKDLGAGVAALMRSFSKS